MQTALGTGAVQFAGKGLVHDLVDQRTFTGTRHTCDTGQHAKGYFHVDVFQIVLSCAADGKETLGFLPLGGHGEILFTA